MNVRLLLLFFSFVLLHSPCFAGGKVILATGEWPPYVSADLEGQGATVEVVRAAFKAVGVDVEIRFYPWTRTMYEAKHDKALAGYFPEYPREEVESEFLLSDSIGKSPLGFAKIKGRRIQWLTHSDLTKYSIATVRGYANGERLDAMVKAGDIVADESVSDTFVLRKVLAGRVDYGVIDINTFDYLMKADVLLRKGKQNLEMDSHLLEVLNLHVCFNQGARGERMRDLFNEGLKRIRPMLIQRQYFQDLRN